MGVAQVVKPPYILGKNDVRIKSKNFLARKKPRYDSYQIYNNRKPGGASIEFNKKTNEFEIVTGAGKQYPTTPAGQQELHNAEKFY